MSFLQEYTLLGELGQGGFAKVYKVRHNELGYIRAIRVLNEPVTDEKSRTYQKFLRECKVLLRLGNGIHPNIVHIYQPRLLENHALVEMDFVDGKDLLHYLNANDNFIPVDEVLRMVKEISSALAYCHEDIYRFCMDRTEDHLQDDPNDGSKVLLDEATRQRLIKKYKVIHNDIHSGNIIRREDGSFVLLDFGLAITDGADVRNSSRHENGAMEYKAPEKWEDDTVLTEQSDIYSFGIVMYEYLAGRVPFPYDTTDSNKMRAGYALGEAHKNQTPPPILYIRKSYFEEKYPGKTYEKDYPDWLEETIIKCLEKNPAKRFKNGKELYELVNKHIDAESVDNLRSMNHSLTEELDLLKQQQQAASELIQRLEQEKKDAEMRLKKATRPPVANKIWIFDIFGSNFEWSVGEYQHYYVFSRKIDSGSWKTRIDELRTYISNEVTSCYMTWCMKDYGWWLSKAIYNPSHGSRLMFSVCIGSYRPKDGHQAIALLDELAYYFSSSENWYSENAYSKINDLEYAFDVVPCETVDFAEPSLPPKAAYWSYDSKKQLADLLTFIRQNGYQYFSRIFFVSQDQADGMRHYLKNLNDIIRIKKAYTITLPTDGSCICDKKEILEGETAKLTYQKSGMNSQTVTITGGMPSPYCLVDSNNQEMRIQSSASANIRFTRIITVTCTGPIGYDYKNFELSTTWPGAIRINNKSHVLTIPENYSAPIELTVVSTDNSFKPIKIKFNPTTVSNNSIDIKLKTTDITPVNIPKEDKPSFRKKHRYLILILELLAIVGFTILNIGQVGLLYILIIDFIAFCFFIWRFVSAAKQDNRPPK